MAEVNWQRINTAPNDVMVLLWVVNAYGHGHVKTGFVDGSVVRSCFDDGDSLGYVTEECATHWQPLPHAPGDTSCARQSSETSAALYEALKESIEYIPARARPVLLAKARAALALAEGKKE